MRAEEKLERLLDQLTERQREQLEQALRVAMDRERVALAREEYRALMARLLPATGE